MSLKIDYVGKGKSQGEVAEMLTNGRIDPGMMRPWLDEEDGSSNVTIYTGGDPNDLDNYETRPTNNATLRRDEWKQLDKMVIPIAESRLQGIADLIDKGLVYNLGNAMGTTVLEQHDVSDALEAVLSMDGVTRAQADRVDYSTTYLPIPIIHADYEINARALATSRNMGNPLDTTMAERAARKVANYLEQMLFTSTSYTWGGGTIYSYLNYPYTNAVSLTTAWTSSAKLGAHIINDVLEMKQSSITDLHFGPWQLYVPVTYETKLDEDYSTAKGSNTIRERILAIAGISGIRVVDTLTTDNVLLVQMTSDVVRLVQGMPLQNVEWTTEGKWITKYKVLTIAVPQIRSDQEGHCGVVHGSFA